MGHEPGARVTLAAAVVGRPVAGKQQRRRRRLVQGEGDGENGREGSPPRVMPRLTVNGTELYYELRGSGPPVLLIMGGSGDGGHFDALADLLADEFTVVTYDRRGNGRSRVPVGWETTSAEEQADDAAALLTALGTGARGGIRHEQRRKLLVVSAGASSRGGARHDPARTGIVRPA
jgi:alpha/beta hydrolase family protein